MSTERDQWIIDQCGPGLSANAPGTCASCAHWRGRGESGRCATPTGMWAVAIGESSAFIRTRVDHGCNAWTPREGGSR